MNTMTLEKEMATHSSILAWKNPMDLGAWQATVHGVTKSRTRLRDFTFTMTQAPAGKFLWSWSGAWTRSDKPATQSEGISNCAPISGKEQCMGITDQG